MRQTFGSVPRRVSACCRSDSALCATTRSSSAAFSSPSDPWAANNQYVTVHAAIVAQHRALVGLAGGQAVIGAAADVAIDFDAHVHLSAIGTALLLRNVDLPFPL